MRIPSFILCFSDQESENIDPKTNGKQVADLFVENDASPLTSTQRKKKGRKATLADYDDEEEAPPPKARKRLGEPVLSLGEELYNPVDDNASPVTALSPLVQDSNKDDEVMFLFTSFFFNFGDELNNFVHQRKVFIPKFHRFHVL